MRIGLVGAGFMGGVHLSAYANIPEVEVVGVADANGFTLRLVDVEFMESESAVFDLGNIPLQEYDSASASATATASPGP